MQTQHIFYQQQNKRLAEINLKILVLNRVLTCLTCFLTKIRSIFSERRKYIFTYVVLTHCCNTFGVALFFNTDPYCYLKQLDLEVFQWQQILTIT